MTVRITLVCHGSTEALRRAVFPTDDDGLDEGGHRDTARAAPSFASPGRPEGVVLCGPARRCRETAEGLGLAAAVVDDRLRDRDHGRWAGRSLAEIQAEDPAGPAAWLTDPAAAPHGGESVLALVERVAAWLASRREPSGRVIAVTHPDVIRAALVHVLDAATTAFSAIDVEPLATVRLTTAGGRWRLRFPRPT
ncbi:phosphoglycerate mutase [Sphaerisporangium melleum]|uniref:Phosphoglycerate mutase n=1 Tax=Sphaerisporangium melleum TaxID=321316 RepID=A0A917RKR4_9ACTN|nr:histidine phosphatase family protein [Sphaerisporangium melleum]GGL13090.1 phosphoglycerate mutase [Sphaerisporangium melleum]GII69541.1 phosphoglycerate mutase [Sphaerisporangium melleum]